ncbi:hypothetical protein SAY87_011293 [Trapa incisa]|uniref:Uncharacterized protein n=1 Tax=Trapa incisa TaxID=236973 RepID=A0AAN7JBD6_9MYRT|nr:hypothetical protein SAY87_011293 [Trapa incisa]
MGEGELVEQAGNCSLGLHYYFRMRSTVELDYLPLIRIQLGESRGSLLCHCRNSIPNNLVYKKNLRWDQNSVVLFWNLFVCGIHMQHALINIIFNSFPYCLALSLAFMNPLAGSPEA